MCPLSIICLIYAFCGYSAFGSLDNQLYDVKIGGIPRLFSEFDSNALEVYSKFGQQFFCMVDENGVSLAPPSPRQVNATYIHEKLSVFAPPKCIQRNSGWWSYSLCYKGEILQFHEVNGEKMSQTVLGRYHDESDWVLTDINSPEYVGKYHRQNYTNGTICNLTGKPRTTEVRYFCASVLGPMILSVEEPESCVYLIKVSIPGFCSHPVFTLTKPNTTKNIQCQPALSADKMESFTKSKEEKDSLLRDSLEKKRREHLIIQNKRIKKMKHLWGKLHIHSISSIPAIKRREFNIFIHKIMQLIRKYVSNLKALTLPDANLLPNLQKLQESSSDFTTITSKMRTLSSEGYVAPSANDESQNKQVLPPIQKNIDAHGSSASKASDSSQLPSSRPSTSSVKVKSNDGIMLKKDLAIDMTRLDLLESTINLVANSHDTNNALKACKLRAGQIVKVLKQTLDLPVSLGIETDGMLKTVRVLVTVFEKLKEITDPLIFIRLEKPLRDLFSSPQLWPKSLKKDLEAMRNYLKSSRQLFDTFYLLHQSGLELISLATTNEGSRSWIRLALNLVNNTIPMSKLDMPDSASLSSTTATRLSVNQLVMWLVEDNPSILELRSGRIRAKKHTGTASGYRDIDELIDQLRLDVDQVEEEGETIESEIDIEDSKVDNEDDMTMIGSIGKETFGNDAVPTQEQPQEMIQHLVKSLSAQERLIQLFRNLEELKSAIQNPSVLLQEGDQTTETSQPKDKTSDTTLKGNSENSQSSTVDPRNEGSKENEERRVMKLNLEEKDVSEVDPLNIAEKKKSIGTSEGRVENNESHDKKQISGLDQSKIRLVEPSLASPDFKALANRLSIRFGRHFKFQGGPGPQDGVFSFVLVNDKEESKENERVNQMESNYRFSWP